MRVHRPTWSTQLPFDKAFGLNLHFGCGHLAPSLGRTIIGFILGCAMSDSPREAYRQSSKRLEDVFETSFPRAACEFAEKTIDQTREAYECSSSTLEAAVRTLERSFDAAGQGAAALRREIIDITHRNVNLGFELATSLAGASTLYEIVELQTDYWRKQFEVLSQADEFHIRLFEFDAAERKTVQPSPESIGHEPARKTPVRVQEAAKNTESPAARERVAWQGHDAQKPARPPAAGPTVRPRVARRTVTQEKGAREDEPIRQDLPADIKFGMLDGNAVRFTNLEAWWLVDGAWRPISLDEVLLNAAVMREARFNQVFPKVPRLPSNAFKP